MINPFEYLCCYDKRNPNNTLVHYDEDEEVTIARSNCSCDNCFYGRDKLALEIIRLKEEA